MNGANLPYEVMRLKYLRVIFTGPRAWAETLNPPLKRLIDRCHERGRYHLLNYQLPLEPPLSPEDIVWVEEVLRHGHVLG